MTLRIVVVESRPMLRRGLVSFFNTLPGAKVVGEASGCTESGELIRASQPDLVVFDFWLADGRGIDIVRCCREHYPRLNALVYTDDCRPETIAVALASNIDGYVLSTSPPQRLRDAVMTIAAGRRYLDPVVTDIAMQGKKSESLARTDSLTPGEEEILSLIREGKANKEIARGIHVSEPTVKFHVSNVLRRLDARSRLHAVHLAADRAGDLVSRIAG